jgi:glycopeptide antibiotics resistance protein
MLSNKICIVKIAIYTFIFSFTIEISQYVFRKGVTEVDDLILNTIGAIIGYLLYKKSASKGR